AALAIESPQLREELQRFQRIRRPAGWGTWIRTKTNRVRVCCATVTPFPNEFPNKFNVLDRCSEAECELERNSAISPRALLPARSRTWQVQSFARVQRAFSRPRPGIGGASGRVVRCNPRLVRMASRVSFELPIFGARLGR